MKYKYLYEVFNPNTGEFYIGSRVSKVKPILDTKYMGSMKRWKPNKEELQKTILYIFNKEVSNEKLLLYEAEIIKMFIDDKLNRNYLIPPYRFFVKEFTKKHREKIRLANLGKKVSEENKLRMKIYNKGKSKRKGTKHTKETINKISKANKGKPSPNKGKKASEETKYKQSIAHLGQVSAKKINVIQKNLQGILIEEFNSLSEASKKTGISMGSISNSLNGKIKNPRKFLWEKK